MELIEVMKLQEEFLESLKNKTEYFLIVVGENGSGKSTLLNSIAKMYEDVGKYDLSNNRQFKEPNMLDQDEYIKGVHSRIISTGESLFEELSDNFDKDIIIFDEPNATLDLFKTSITVESFIRNKAKIRVIATNDYLTLKLLSGYTNIAYNCETGENCNINEFLNDMIDKTYNELVENSPFKEINRESYDTLKLEV